MSDPASLIVEAQFASTDAAQKVKRYLPSRGRVALVDDVPEVDRDLYTVVERLECASVEAQSTTVLRCSFDVEDVEDPE